MPAQRVDGEIADRLEKTSRTARLKGFSPAKAPLQVIQKQFGEQVRAEVLGDLMRSSLAEAINQEKLRPAAGPRIEPLATESGTDLKYAAVFEVLPEVQISFRGGPGSAEIGAPSPRLNVEAMIESMRKQRPVFAEVDRPARDTDRVTIDFTARMPLTTAEHAHKHDNDASFIVGEGASSLAELNEAAKGARAGDHRTHSDATAAGSGRPRSSQAARRRCISRSRKSRSSHCRA